MSATARTPAAVFFDMDGLLVDTEPVWFEVERGIVTDLGGDWSAADSAKLVGGSLKGTIAHILDVTGAAADPEWIAGRLLDGMTRRLRAGVPLQPGAKPLIAELAAAGVPLALVTSSQPQHMRAVLATVGADVFTDTVCSADVTHVKPHPEPYLTAAARLGVEPARCVVLEDSLNGTLAGEAAGCAVVTVPSVAPVPDGPGRTVVSSLNDVDLAFLRTLLPKGV
ncbi:MAG TPA: HAD family phosphatase [Streptosporangiaceae bacterium]